MFDYRYMHYMEVLIILNCGEYSFSCEPDMEFLDTLANDGYDEFRKSVPESTAEKIKGGSTSDFETGNIYIKNKDAYANIYIHKETSSKYFVEIKIVPACFVVKEANKAFASKAFAAMSGD